SLPHLTEKQDPLAGLSLLRQRRQGPGEQPVRAAIRNRQATEVVEDDSGWLFEVPLRLPGALEDPGRVVLHDPSGHRARQEDGVSGADREVRLGVEILPARDREHLQEFPLSVEDLYPVVAGVGDVDVAGAVRRESHGLDELSLADPVSAEL